MDSDLAQRTKFAQVTLQLSNMYKGAAFNAISPREAFVLLCTCTTTGWLPHKGRADVSDCVTVKREVVPLGVSSVLFCPSGNYKPGQVCFPLFLFTDKVSGAGGCIQFPGQRRRADVWLHCQDTRETHSRRTTDTEVTLYYKAGLLNLQTRLENV